VARWEGDAPGRLERAALTLFGEQGYDRTTVAQIARRANLTERSFYRWFADKREVLFGGAGEFQAHLVAAIDAVPAGTAPLPTLLAAFATAPEVIRPPDFLLARSAVIAANPPLRERELVKLAALGDALTDALARRGCDEQMARLATDAGLAVMRLASRRALAGEHTDFAEALAAGASDLSAIAAEAARSTSVTPTARTDPAGRPRQDPSRSTH
jgi:AcrR family transcriptional regulator